MPVRVTRRGGKTVRVPVRFRLARYRRPRIANLMKGIHSVELKQIVQVYGNGSGAVKTEINDGQVSGYNDWTALGNLFDLYRVKSIHLKYIPCGNVTVTQTLAAGSGSGTANTPLYVFYDADNTATPSTVTADANALEYESCRVKSMNTMWSYHKTMEKVMGLSGGARTVRSGGWLDVAAASTNASQVIVVYKDAATGFVLQANQQCGTLVVTQTIQFKNKR